MVLSIESCLHQRLDSRYLLRHAPCCETASYGGANRAGFRVIVVVGVRKDRTPTNN